MGENSKYLELTKDGYVNIQPLDGDALDEITYALCNGHVKLHIFDIAFMYIENLMESIFKKAKANSCIVTIYIPWYMQDYVPWFRYVYPTIADDPSIRFVIIRGFRPTKDFLIASTDKKLSVSYESIEYEYRLTWRYNMEELCVQNLIKTHYTYENGVVKNILMKQYPWIFKKDIIENFNQLLRETHMDVTFLDDDTKWDFICDSYNLAPEEDKDDSFIDEDETEESI